MTWLDSTQERYWYMLEVLPPAAQLPSGFLVGEPADHRTCQVTGKVLPRYEAYVNCGHDGFWTAERPLTIPEFKQTAGRGIIDRSPREEFVIGPEAAKWSGLDPSETE